MHNAPKWDERIRDAVEKIVLENVNILDQTEEEIEERDNGMDSKTAILSDKKITRHIFVLSVDTTEMQEVDNGQQKIISGIQSTELMMGSLELLIACIIQFMKSNKARPLLLKAMLEGLDLGGFEKSVLTGNVSGLMDMLLGNKPA